MNPVEAQAANYRVCGNSNWGNISGGNTVNMRAKLGNPANFGPGGTFSEHTLTFVNIGFPSTANLVANSCDIWFSGFDNDGPYTDLPAFIAGGGFVIGGCDSVGFDGVCAGLGHSVTNYSNVGGGYTNTTPTNPLICDSGTPNPSLNLTTAGGASSYFSSGVTLAQYSDGSGLPLAITNDLSGPNFVLTGDIDMFTNFNPQITAGGAVTTDQDKFVVNVFKLATDVLSGAFATNGGVSCQNISAWNIVKPQPSNADNDGSGSVTEGDVLTYTITVTNTGTLTLTNVVVTDNLISPSSQTCASVAPGGTCVLSGTYVVQASDVTAGQIDNTASATSIEIPGPLTTTTTTQVFPEPSALAVTKTANVNIARIGDVVSYTITISNNDTLDQINVDLVDFMPAGFTYRPGTARIDGTAVEPTRNGRKLVWSGQTIPANGSVVLTLSMGVGPAATADELVNFAWAESQLSGEIISNKAKAVVRLEIEHVFNCGEIIGKVFNDKNRNGYQNKGERGLPGVRLATVRGVLITTDKHGRYNVPCAQIPDSNIGSNFILKLDTRTLPTGYKLTTENPRVVRLTRGKVTKLNFGASIGFIIQIKLTGEAFVTASPAPGKGLRNSIGKLTERIAGKTGAKLSVTYITGAESRVLVRQRLNALEALLKTAWPAFNKNNIETKIVAGR